ncbi:MAG: BrnT family toxin [Pyrinomonadaceae bacterium]
MEFEWDEAKAEENYRKHLVRFEDAVKAFDDPNGVELLDILNSDSEIRYQLIGLTERSLLLVAFSERNENIRIFSARKATSKQIRFTMNGKDKELMYVVTEEEYREELASGLTEDEVMKPGTYKVIPSRFRAKPGTTDLKNCKVKVSMYVDADILEYFKKRAEQPNAAPYQTQINSELRKVMENETSNAVRGADDILNNTKFLKALKEKLETV